MILEIFAIRARTREAKLQVELANLIYERPKARMKVTLAKRGEQPGFKGLGRYQADIYESEITGKIAQRMGMEVCSIYRNLGGDLVLAATHGLAKDAVGKVRLSIGEGITGRVVETGKPIVVPRVSREPAMLNRAADRRLRSPPCRT